MKVGIKKKFINREELPPVPEKMKQFTDTKTGKKKLYNIGGNKTHHQTELREAYKNPNGKKASMLKTKDNLKNGNIRIIETTNEKHFGHIDENLNKNEKNLNNNLGSKNKEYDRKGKVLNTEAKDLNALQRK